MSSTNTENVSKVTAIKDQTIGTIKETVGNLFGNEKMELEGKAQKVHGKNEMSYAKANKNGETEPQHFQEAYGTHPDHPHHTTEQTVNHPQHTTNDINNNLPPVPPHQNIPHQPIGTGLPLNPTAVAPIPPHQPNAVPPVPPQNISGAPIPPSGAPIPPSAATGASIPPPGNIHEHAEGSVEGGNVSTLGAMKDKMVGSIKESFGSATGNQNMELQGKAQNIHGHNQSEFAKAQKEGLNEPAHFEKGTKVNDHAEGTVEGQNHPSSIGALKDQAVGSIKQSFGSATGNTNTEIAGAAQKMHGKNESEFAKAQKEGLNEPAHFEHGTKTTDTAL
jgi:uncharacterized protein YjbJ (UPF0337 family)